MCERIRRKLKCKHKSIYTSLQRSRSHGNCANFYFHFEHLRIEVGDFRGRGSWEDKGEGYGRREKKKRGGLKGRELSRRSRWKLHVLTLHDVMSWCNNWPGVGVVGGASVTWLLPTAKLQFSSFSWTAFNWRDIFFSWAHMAVMWLVWLNISGMSRVLFSNSFTCCLSAAAFQRKAIWRLAYVQTLYGEEINQLKCKSSTIQVL